MSVTNRVLVFGTDAAYYEYTVISLRSFLLHNPGWPVLVMDVGMTPDQARSMRQLARVVRYPREDFRGTGRHIPSAKARCLALARYPSDDTLMLYLDGDSVTMGSFEPLVERFLASGKPVGLAAEDDARFFTAPVHRSWEGSEIPDEFPGSGRWRDRPVLNTGVLLAVGARACRAGARASTLYEALKTRFQFGEQTIINSVIYEDEVPVFPIETAYHCFIREEYLEKQGRPYVDPVLLDGERVVFRHFCHGNKEFLDGYRTELLDHYGSREVRGAVAPARRVLGVCPSGYLDPRDPSSRLRRSVLEGLAKAGLAVEVVCGPLPQPAVETAPAAAPTRPEAAPEGVDATPEAPPPLVVEVRGVTVMCQVAPPPAPPGDDTTWGEGFLRLFETVADQGLHEVVLVSGAAPLAREVLARARARGVATAVLVDTADRFAYRDPAFFQDADLVLAPSQLAADYLYEATGVPCSALAPPVDRDGAPGEPGAAGYVTLFDPTPENGVYALARIVEELRRRRPEIPLLVVEGRADAASLCASGLDLAGLGNVTFRPASLDNRETWSQTRVCLAPQLGWETYPLAAAEAVARGIPVVGSDRGALPEVLGPAGLMLPLPGRLTPLMRVVPTALDVAAWVETIIRLWDDSAFFAEHRRHALDAARGLCPTALAPHYSHLIGSLRTGDRPVAPPPPRRSRAVVLVPHLNEIEPECEQSLRALERAGVQVVRRMGSSQIDVARNEMISDALHHGAESILFIDADIGFDPLDALRLLARPEPVALGVYSKKARRELTSVFAEGIPEVTFGQDEPGPYPIRYAATGFLRIRADVLWRMISELKLPLCNTRWGKGVWPFFQPMIVPMGEDSLHYLGEDWAFSHRLGLMGVVPVADTSFRLFHWGRFGYSWEEAGEDRPRYRNYTLHF